MRKTVLFFLFSFLLIQLKLQAQSLRGRVLNEKGKAAAHVTLRFSSESRKVESDNEGRFSIATRRLPDTLLFSSDDYETYRVVVTEKTMRDPDFEVVLLDKREDVKSYSEVVVTSLGAKRRAKETGYASSTISGDMLLGRTAGVDGSGSTIRIRGARTITGEYSPASPGTSAPADPRFYLRDTNIVSKTSGMARSRLLTAGEVNDFTKWKMWEEYSESEFKTYSAFWGMYTQVRFSVQLTDKKFNALVNEPLYLLERRSDDTVWKAFTDNTGKAELWAGFESPGAEAKDYVISDSRGNRIEHPTMFDKGLNLLVIDKPCETTNEVEMAFVVDATGSMGDEIEFLKLELEDVIRNSMEKYKSLSLRAASVFYRDRGDEYVTKEIDFNEDLLKTINFIKLQGADGGGDYPEAVDEALETALEKLAWSSKARTRLLFLLLDAPPHDQAKEKMIRLTRRAAAMGIRVIPVACSGTNKSTEFLLRSMALATNGTYAFLTNHSGIGNDHIEPTTDKYEIELLGDLLQRIIGQFIYARECGTQTNQPDEQNIFQPENILLVKIYPNPTNGQFTIESNQEIREIFVSDFAGKILLRMPTAADQRKWSVDISGYPSATYLVRYITRDNKWGAAKLVLFRK